MKNFDSILTNCLKNKGLKYIRFKVDPTLNKGFERSDSYEGFVLQELTNETCGGAPIGLPPILKVLMPGGPLPGIFNVKKHCSMDIRLVARIGNVPHSPNVNLRLEITQCHIYYAGITFDI